MPPTAGTKSSWSSPTIHSTSKAISALMPWLSPLATWARANERWHPAYTVPSWWNRSPGAQAQPSGAGSAAK